MTAFAPEPPASEPPAAEPAPEQAPTAQLEAPPEDSGGAPISAPASDPAMPAEAPPEAAPEEPLPPPSADPFHVESIVAAVGIRAFLDGSLRRIHLYHLARAGKIGDEIDRKLHLFLGRTEPAHAAPLPAWDFSEVRQMLDDYKPSTDEHSQPQDIANLIGAFGELTDVGLAVVPVIDRIRNYLWARIPRRSRMTLLGPEDEAPPHSDVARFRRLWNIACDPLSILDDLNEYALSRDMVDGVQEMFPLIWQRMDGGVTNQLARKKAQSPKFSLSVRKDGLLRILVKQETPDSLALGIAMQAQFAAQAAANQPKPPSAPKRGVGQGGSTESSAADRIGSA